MKSILQYFREVKLELSKVVWPKRTEVMRMTFVVVLISVVVASYVGIIDFTFTKLLESVVSR